MSDVEARGERVFCPGCRRDRVRLPRLFLCRWCCGLLPLRTRCALWRVDGAQRERFEEFRRQVLAGRPLSEIRIER